MANAEELYKKINQEIDFQTKKIDLNERSQDQYIVKNGCMDQLLLDKHDSLVDEMQELLERRHKISAEL